MQICQAKYPCHVMQTCQLGEIMIVLLQYIMQDVSLMRTHRQCYDGCKVVLDGRHASDNVTCFKC